MLTCTVKMSIRKASIKFDSSSINGIRIASVPSASCRLDHSLRSSGGTVTIKLWVLATCPLSRLRCNVIWKVKPSSKSSWLSIVINERFRTSMSEPDRCEKSRWMRMSARFLGNCIFICSISRIECDFYLWIKHRRNTQAMFENGFFISE